MSSTEGSELADILQSRLDSIVDRWHHAIAQTSYVSLDSARVREHLAIWAQQIVYLLTSKPFDRDKAAAIGNGLAGLHYLQPEALSQTQDILSRYLVEGLSPDQLAFLYPNLALLLVGMTFGFYSHARKTILSEQEEIRDALVGELARMANALQDSRDHLELRVRERTRELEILNEELHREIWERERIAHALGESEERYRTVSELVSDYVYSLQITSSGALVMEWATDAHNRITGYSVQEIRDRQDWKELVCPDDWPIVERHRQRHLSGVAGVSEYRIISRSGQIRWVRDHSQPVWDKIEGRTLRVYGAIQDITERKMAEEALRKSESKYRMLLESIHDGVFTLDVEGRFTFVNAIVSQRSGRPIGWFLGRRFADTIRPSDTDRVQKHLEAALRGEPVPIYELAYRTVAGNVQWVEVNTTSLWEEGRIVGIHAVSRDVTERKKIEELKDNLIRDVSHELRTPLAKLCMGLDLLNEALEAKEINRDRAIRIGGVVRSNVTRLLRTVQVMLDLSSLESGQIHYSMEEIDPGKLMKDVVQDMYPLAAIKGLELVVDLPAKLPFIVGDRERLFRVLANLLDNAIKFTDDGAITLSAVESSHELVLAVHDPGLGILPENLEKVFEKFFQEKTRFHGVGVGLAICKTVVEAHGGKIWAESSGRGLGTMMQFTLPITPL